MTPLVPAAARERAKAAGAASWLDALPGLVAGLEHDWSIAAVAAVFVWAAGERFGSLFSGSATDPNSGPLLLLIAAAFWPRRQR